MISNAHIDKPASAVPCVLHPLLSGFHQAVMHQEQPEPQHLSETLWWLWFSCLLGVNMAQNLQLQSQWLPKVCVPSHHQWLSRSCSMVDVSHQQLHCHPQQCLSIQSHGPAILQHHNVSINIGSRDASSIMIHVICHTLSILWSSIQGIDPDHHLQQETAYQKGKAMIHLFACRCVYVCTHNTNKWLFIYDLFNHTSVASTRHEQGSGGETWGKETTWETHA